MLEPDRCAEAARSLAAEMVAGQAVDLMFSIMPNAGVVVVARGPAARRLLLLFSSDGPPGSFRVEPVKPR